MGIITVGTIIGILAALLQKMGNPGNMGICVACFERDIAGALGLHRADIVQYVRPEIMGFVLGALIAAAERAARINRTAGQLAQPTPATTVAEIIKFLPQATMQFTD